MALTQIRRAGITANARDRVSVLDYIPVAQHAAIRAGTSTYDATSAIQSAITDSAPNPDEARAVFFPAGKYTCDSGLTLLTGTKLIGEALEKTEHFVHKGTGTVIQFGSGGITASGQNKIEFYNITLRTESDYTDQYVVKFDAVYACRFHNVVISHQGTHASATGLYMDDYASSNTTNVAWSNFFDNCQFSTPRMANSAGGHTIEFLGSDSWFNGIYSSGGKGILTKAGGNNWSNIHCEHSHSGSAKSATGTNAGFTVKVDSYTGGDTQKIINVSNLYCDLNDIAVKWESNGTAALHQMFNFSNVLCRNNENCDFLITNSGSGASAFGGSIVNYHSKGAPSTPIKTSGTVTKPYISTEGSSITDIGIGIDTDSPNSNLKLDIGGAHNTGLTSLQQPVLYAGLANNTNFGGVVLGSGVNGNTPFVAASKLSNGNDLPLHLITGGTQRLSVTNDSSNNTFVGIGDTTPECTLDVGGASTGGLNGLSRPVLYAGYDQASTNNFGGIVLGTGPTANTPYVASAKTFGGTAQSLSFYTNATKRLSIHQTTGDINIEDGNLKFASGHGIDFSATSDASGIASEVLDDYEEGSFTPEVNAGVSAISYSTQAGRYTKIGNTVHFTFTIRINSATLTSSAIKFAGLPFTSVNDADKAGGAFIHQSSGNFGTTSTFRVMGNTNQIRVATAAGDAMAGTATSFNTSNRFISLTGFYTV